MASGTELYEIDWRVIDTGGRWIDGKLPPMSDPVEIKDLETALFVEVARIEREVVAWRREPLVLEKLFVSLEQPDGSGHVRHYQKRGDVWILIHRQ